MWLNDSVRCYCPHVMLQQNHQPGQKRLQIPIIPPPNPNNVPRNQWKRVKCPSLDHCKQIKWASSKVTLYSPLHNTLARDSSRFCPYYLPSIEPHRTAVLLQHHTKKDRPEHHHRETRTIVEISSCTIFSHYRETGSSIFFVCVVKKKWLKNQYCWFTKKKKTAINIVRRPAYSWKITSQKSEKKIPQMENIQYCFIQ